MISDTGITNRSDTAAATCTRASMHAVDRERMEENEHYKHIPETTNNTTSVTSRRRPRTSNHGAFADSFVHQVHGIREAGYI